MASQQVLDQLASMNFTVEYCCQLINHACRRLSDVCHDVRFMNDVVLDYRSFVLEAIGNYIIYGEINIILVN